jgi:hypothetical protein
MLMILDKISTQSQVASLDELDTMTQQRFLEYEVHSAHFKPIFEEKAPATNNN